MLQEHIDAGQEVGIYVVLIFRGQVLCVTKYGHRYYIYLLEVSELVVVVSSHKRQGAQYGHRFLPLILGDAYSYAPIQFLYISMFPFLMTLPHNVCRMLDNPFYYRRKLVESLCGKQRTDYSTMHLVLVWIAETVE